MLTALDTEFSNHSGHLHLWTLPGPVMYILVTELDLLYRILSLWKQTIIFTMYDIITKILSNNI